MKFSYSNLKADVRSLSKKSIEIEKLMGKGCAYLNCSTKPFSDYDKLQQHLLLHEKVGHKEIYDSRGFLKCFHCGWTLFRHEPKKLLKHVFYEHPENEIRSDYVCELCGKYFYDSIDLDKHIKNDHENGTDIICDKCGQLCESKLDLKQHNKGIHLILSVI